MVLTPPWSPRKTRVPGGPELLLGFSIFFGCDVGRWEEELAVEGLISGDLDGVGDNRGLYVGIGNDILKGG
jgi:hypothetical protein